MSRNGYTTTSRTKILEFLKNNCDRTVKVSDIQKYLINTGHEVNITTIYRYLDKLSNDGTVMKYVSEKGTQAVYQYIDLGLHCENHLHLQCTKCGAIFHLDCSFMSEIAEHILAEHGFAIQCKNSIIYGLCPKCQDM